MQNAKNLKKSKPDMSSKMLKKGGNEKIAENEKEPE